MKFLDSHKKSDALLKLDIKGGKDNYQLLDNLDYNFHFFSLIGLV